MRGGIVTPQESLRRAAALIEIAQRALPEHSPGEVCERCGARSAESREDHRIAETLRSIRERALTLVGLFDARDQRGAHSRAGIEEGEVKRRHCQRYLQEKEQGK
jgi:hypothetical protein